MVSFIKQMLFGVKAKPLQPGVYKKANYHSNKNFTPAPSYWALIPVKAHSQQRTKPSGDFEESL